MNRNNKFAGPQRPLDNSEEKGRRRKQEPVTVQFGGVDVSNHSGTGTCCRTCSSRTPDFHAVMLKKQMKCKFSFFDSPEP